MGRLYEYGWVCFASAPAVQDFFDRLAAAGKDARALADIQVAAVGPATAEALRAQGVRADFQPQTATGAALGEELPGELARHTGSLCHARWRAMKRWSETLARAGRRWTPSPLIRRSWTARARRSCGSV